MVARYCCIKGGGLVRRIGGSRFRLEYRIESWCWRENVRHRIASDRIASRLLSPRDYTILQVRPSDCPFVCTSVHPYVRPTTSPVRLSVRPVRSRCFVRGVADLTEGVVALSWARFHPLHASASSGQPRGPNRSSSPPSFPSPLPLFFSLALPRNFFLSFFSSPSSSARSSLAFFFLFFHPLSVGILPIGVCTRVLANLLNPQT